MSEEELKLLLRQEVKRRPAPRQGFLQRIYCRYSRVRRDREMHNLGLR